jgi:hypothetical protein
MQTFLPYPSFEETAKILDYKRLGKQRVEAYQIANIIEFPYRYKCTNIIFKHSFFEKTAMIFEKQCPVCGFELRQITAWQNHPAVKMWIGPKEDREKYLNCLKLYIDSMIKEWINRGYNNTMKLSYDSKKQCLYPEWIGNEDFHKSHMSNLLRKNKNYYSKYFENIHDDLPYVWPENK